MPTAFAAATSQGPLYLYVVDVHIIPGKVIGARIWAHDLDHADRKVAGTGCKVVGRLEQEL